MSDKVSVLINCYNSAKYLRQAIESVYAQTHQNFEILFVDNCSTDESSQIAQSFDDRVVMIKTPENIPLYAARNFGLEKMSGDFFAILDADDWWEKNRLSSGLLVLQDQTDLAFVFSDWKEYLEAAGPLKKSIYYTLGKYRSFIHSNGEVSFSDILKNYRINLQTILVRSPLMKGMRFNTQMNHIGDFDFLLRLLKGRKAYYLSEKLSVTRIHAHQLTNGSWKTWPKEFELLKNESWYQELSSDEKKLFDYYPRFYRFLSLNEDGKFKEARELIGPYRFHGLETYYRYLKSYSKEWL